MQKPAIRRALRIKAERSAPSFHEGGGKLPTRRVFGLGELQVALPLRDSAGLVHIGLTGFPHYALRIRAASAPVGYQDSVVGMYYSSSVRDLSIFCRLLHHLKQSRRATGQTGWHCHPAAMGDLCLG